MAAAALFATLLAGPAATIPHVERGAVVGELDPVAAGRRGLTVIDLSDDWAPSPFAAEVAYRATLVALANRMPAGELVDHALEGQRHELLGVFPSITLLSARLADAPRHACHDAVPAGGGEIAWLQSHLSCEGLLPASGIDGKAGPRTAAALGRFRLRHMIPTTGPLDDQTRAALRAGSRELDFRALLRVLRERVVDATGLIEDGSACGAPGRVLDRELDAAELRDASGWPALPRCAPDLVSPATEAAARALGWTGPDEALGSPFLDARRRGRVAIALPAHPHPEPAELALRAEIDRGDVFRRWRDRGRRVERRPSLVLYEGEVALVRWPTTIGGWQREKLPDGRVVNRYKASDPGDYVWRDIVVAPVWFAPPSTPDRELVRRAGSGWAVREDTIGPGTRSAYGLIMLMHHRAIPTRAGVRYADTAVRTHGSVNFRSLQAGSSHGCHRLYNHLALRLGGFVLRHHAHEVVGALDDRYQRRVTAGERTMWIRRDTRGYGYRLLDPVPLRVLVGTVH
jgi:hypothetical protein